MDLSNLHLSIRIILAAIVLVIGAVNIGMIYKNQKLNKFNWFTLAGILLLSVI